MVILFIKGSGYKCDANSFCDRVSLSDARGLHFDEFLEYLV